MCWEKKEKETGFSSETEKITVFIFKKDLQMLGKAPPTQSSKVLGHFSACLKVKKLLQRRKTKQNKHTEIHLCSLKTDTKSMEVFFLTTEVKTVSSLPRHCPNLNSLKNVSWNSENPVAYYMNITSCNKNLTCFVFVFVIPAFSLDKKKKNKKKLLCQTVILSIGLPPI